MILRRPVNPAQSIYGRNAGFKYPNSVQSPTIYREPQPQVDQQNTYQRRAFAQQPQLINDGAYPNMAQGVMGNAANRVTGNLRQGVIDAFGNMRSDAQNALETGFQQTASDKAYNYGNAQLQRGAAQNVYSQGQANLATDIGRQTTLANASKADEIGSLQTNLENQRASIPATEAKEAIVNQDSKNKLDRQFANLGIMGGSIYGDAAQRYGAFTAADNAARHQQQLNDQSDVLSKITTAGSKWDDLLGNYAQQKTDKSLGLTQNEANQMAQIQNSQDTNDRNTMLQNKGYVDAYGNALSQSNLGTAQALQGWDQADKTNARADRSNDIAIAGLTGMYNGQQTQAAKQQQFQNDIARAGVTGQYNGAMTPAQQAVNESQRQSFQDRFNQAKQQQFQNGISAAGLTGVYNGQPTLGSQKSAPPDFNQAESAVSNFLAQADPRTLDPQEISKFIWSMAPEQTPQMIALRQKLVAAAQARLRVRGFTKPIPATPSGAVRDFNQPAPLSPQQTDYQNFINHQAGVPGY